jgi:hypothetical protein
MPDLAQILGRGLYTSPDGKPLLFAYTGSEAPHSADCMINIDILPDKSLCLSPPDVSWYIYAPRKNNMSQYHHVKLTLIKTRNKISLREEVNKRHFASDVTQRMRTAL